LAYGTWGLAIATWILALLAYCALHDNETISSQGQRAWVGPNQADFIAQLTVNTEAALAIQYQNTGRVPALSVSATGDTMLFTLDESRSGKLQEDVHKSLERCLARKLSKEDSAVYPATGFNNYRMYVNIDKDIIDWDVIYGKKILVLEGCFVYETFQKFTEARSAIFIKQGLLKQTRGHSVQLGTMPISVIGMNSPPSRAVAGNPTRAVPCARGVPGRVVVPLPKNGIRQKLNRS